jgi:cytochrome c biogenesis protein CcmG/thiol:disulfide interchange protein DsbE
MKRLMAVLSLLFVAAVAAGAFILQRRCTPEAVLERSSRFYRDAPVLTDVWTAEIRVPGAPPKRETLEFGFSERADAWMRMPSLYVIERAGGALTVVEDGGTPTRMVRRPVGSDLQQSLDDAFAGGGPPLVPAPLLLRQARSAADRVAAFRLRMLEELRPESCRRLGGGIDEVTFTAANGAVRARFDRRGALLSMAAEIIVAKGQAPITAAITFRPQLSKSPPPLRLPAVAAEVATVEELSPKADPSDEGSLLAALSLPSLAGPELDFERLRGSVVVVEFWATWCAPCRVSLPAVRDFAASARRQGLRTEVVLVNTEEGLSSVNDVRKRIGPYLAAAGIDLPCAIDVDGAFHRRAGSGLPLTLVIGTDGKVIARHTGFSADLEEELLRSVRAVD